MRGYVKFNYAGIRGIPTTEIPDKLTLDEAITYMKGIMFDHGWTFDTTYAMYIKKHDGTSYEFVHGDPDYDRELYEQAMGVPLVAQGNQYPR